MKLYVILSLGLHLFLIFLFLPRGLSEDSKKEGPGGKKSQVQADSPREIQVTLEGPGEKEPCPDFFGGIGVGIDQLTGYITKVYPGYPAERLGIQVGDYVHAEGGNIEGEIGSTVNLTINRLGLIFTLTTKREKICYN